MQTLLMATVRTYLANKYEKLYNRVNDENDLLKIKKVIDQRILGYNGSLENHTEDCERSIE